MARTYGKMEKSANQGDPPVSSVVVSGEVTYQGQTVLWELLAEDAAFLANASGTLMLSCPETVLEFDWGLEPRPKPWQETESKVEWAEDAPTVSVKRRGGWVPVLRLKKIRKAA